MPTIMPKSELVRRAFAYLQEERKHDPGKSLPSLWTRKPWSVFYAVSRSSTEVPFFFPSTFGVSRPYAISLPSGTGLATASRLSSSPPWAVSTMP